MDKHYKDQIAPLPYDPTWLVKLAKKQISDEKQIIKSLRLCKTVVGFCECGCGDPYFIDPKSKDWDFDYNEILQREDGVLIILDIMKNKKIGSIEICEWNQKK